NLRQLLERVAGSVTHAMSRPGVQIDVAVRGDDVYLTSQQATSLALAVNELLQNAFEHAFPARTTGRIEIRMAQQEAGLILEVEDDGQGLPQRFDPTAGTDLGLKAVRAVPVIVLTAYADREFVDKAKDAGVLAYLVKPVRESDLRPTVEVALARFREIRALHDDVGSLEDALATRKLIERAKGVLMRRNGLDET